MPAFFILSFFLGLTDSSTILHQQWFKAGEFSEMKNSSLKQ